MCTKNIMLRSLEFSDGFEEASAKVRQIVQTVQLVQTLVSSFNDVNTEARSSLLFSADDSYFCQASIETYAHYQLVLLDTGGLVRCPRMSKRASSSLVEMDFSDPAFANLPLLEAGKLHLSGIFAIPSHSLPSWMLSS